MLMSVFSTLMVSPVLLADFIYRVDISPDSGVHANAELFTASLILTEIDVVGVNPDISLSNGSGLFGIAMRMERTSGDATLSNFSFSPGFSAFGVNPSPNPTQTPSVWEFNIQSSNPFGNSPGFGIPSTSIVIGTVDITMGTMDSSYSLSNLQIAPPNNLSIGQNLASQRPTFISEYGSASFQISVPEPNGFAILSLILVCRFNRRKRITRVAC